jgi:ribosomal protein S24E
MRILAPLALLLALLAVPAFSLGAGTGKGKDKANAARLCKAQREAMGVNAFRQLYGTNKNRKNAFGKCVSKLAKQQAENRENAAKACKAERDEIGADAFKDKYGTNKNKSNAFGKCVSQHAKQKTEEQQEATINAAKTCKAERAEIGADAFKDKYGTNHNKRNAFGKCVSQHAHAK